jgi:hypothetical protein
MSLYNPNDWYWIKADGGIYSSGQQKTMTAEQAAQNQQYQTWLASGGIPTPYPEDAEGQESEAELAAVLRPFGLYINQGAARQEVILARMRKIEQDEQPRCLREMARGAAKIGQNAFDFAEQKLDALDMEIDALRVELAGLGQTG